MKRVYVLYQNQFREQIVGYFWETNMNEKKEDKWIGLEEASIYMDVTKDTVRNWIKRTDIPAHKIGKLWKFKKLELDEWIKSGKSAL